MMDIYVGNLPYGATDNDLQELFANYGTVTSARVIMDRMTGRSKGFGFVEMPERAEAEQAIENINGSDLQGRPLRVNESQPRPRDGAGGGGGGGGGGRRGGGGGGGGYGGGGGGGGQNRW
ncbi:MAG: RNA-binding protein [Lentisphaerae bacterium]|nr:RNA-binding protein [Lentisphaerota bacterium]